MGKVTNHGLQKSIRGAPQPTSSIIFGRNLRKNAPKPTAEAKAALKKAMEEADD